MTGIDHPGRPGRRVWRGAGRAGDLADVLSTRGSFERLPKWLNLLPMVVQWLWLSLRYRSLTLPSAANRKITSGGMVGDGKLEYFQTMGPLALAATAEFLPFTAGPDFSLPAALAAMQAAGLGFPIVAKPDLGWCGFGVRLLADPLALADYAAAYPAGERFLLQRFIPEEGEAGLFYLRRPEEDRGSLLGILLRAYPQIRGDGRSNLGALVAADGRLRRLTSDPLHSPAFDPRRVPEAGEHVRLALIGSTRVGGLYLDGSAHETPALVARVEAIARDMADFEVGRFDVRFASLGDLEAGAFTIMEVNGAGSEAVHAWDPNYTIPQVYRMVFAKQRALFALGDALRRRGQRPIGPVRLARLYLRQQALMRRYPPSN